MNPNNTSEILKCVNCNITKSLIKEHDHIICKNCNSKFPIIEGVVFAINDKNDFYNYNRKLKRFIEFYNK